MNEIEHRQCRLLEENDPATTAVDFVSINDDVIGRLASSILGNRFVKQLWLHRNQLSSDGVNILISILEKTPSLVELKLIRGNRILTPILQALQSADASFLQHLLLDRVEVDCNHADTIKQVLIANCGLKLLHFYKIDDMVGPNFQSVCQGLRVNYGLEELTLENCELGDAEAESLASVLLENTCLRVLYLNGNNIGCTGAAALAKALESNLSLEYLDLTFNPSIQMIGASAIGSSLPRMKRLKDLKLSFFVPQRDSFAKALLKGVQQSSNAINANSPNVSLAGIRDPLFSKLITYFLGDWHQEFLTFDQDTTGSLWPFALARSNRESGSVNADVLYYYVRTNPHLTFGTTGQ